jgi:hypothetical protein
VLDIDGDIGEATLKKLEGEFGQLPSTVEAITGGGGRHLFFETPDALIRNSAGKIGPGIDVRGEGGYVIAPPSVHPSGRVYAWGVDSAGELAQAPAWLLAKANGHNGNGNGRIGPTPPETWCALIHDGVSEGARNDSLARLTGLLLRRHIDPQIVAELVAAFNDARCQPPLSLEEVRTIVNSICAREMKRRGVS